MEKTIVNVGCGMDIIPGAINLDNSPSASLAKHIIIRQIIRPFMNQSQQSYLDFAITNNITHGNALRLSFPDSSIDLIYTSHMIEHLDLSSMHLFISECFRCLKSDGILRIVTPNLDHFISNYNTNNDAIAFAQDTLYYRMSGNSLKERLQMAISGDRGHKIVYNSHSLLKYLTQHGFQKIYTLSAGQTTIPFHTEIDYSWKSDESLYIEAYKP